MHAAMLRHLHIFSVCDHATNQADGGDDDHEDYDDEDDDDDDKYIDDQ